jgi:hypothetical protein
LPVFFHNLGDKLIISILGSAATKESAELLYKLIDDGLLIEVGDKHGSSDEELAAREAIRSFANQKWVYGCQFFSITLAT